MKKLLVSAASIMLSIGLQAQHKLYDSLFNLIKTRSVYTQHVNWDSLQPIADRQIDHSKTDSIEAFLPAVELLLRSLKDMHSGLSYKGRHYGNPDAIGYVRRKIDTSSYQAAQKGLARLRTELLHGRYGYICIPAAGIEATEDMAKAIQEINTIAQSIADSLCRIQQQPLKGLIMDLRLNGGGSSPALIGGMAALLQEGVCFAFARNDAPKEALQFRNGNLFYDSVQMTHFTPPCHPANKLPVAVLINGYTTSAGEHAAIALKSNPRSKFFGSATRGQITGNETIFIRKDLILHLSTAWAEDNAGRKYPVDVQPDVLITKGYNFEDLNKDSCIQAAITWFKTSKR